MKKLYKINQFTAAEWDGIEYDWDNHEDEILIIEKPNAYCMDITANGKRIVPILRKIEEAMTAAGLAGKDGIYAGWFGEWANNLTDRADRKNFIWDYSGRSDIERGCWAYSWGIEQIDEDCWYIFLNIAKPADKPQEAPAADAEQQPTETENAAQEAAEAAQEAADAANSAAIDAPGTEAAQQAANAARNARQAARQARAAQQAGDTEAARQAAQAAREHAQAATQAAEGTAQQADDITAAILGAIGAPAPAHTITATLIGPDGTPYRATYSADLLGSLRTEPRVLDIQDDDTGEMIYIKPDPAPADQAEAETAPETAEEPETVTAMWKAIHEADAELQRVQDPDYIQAKIDAMTWHTPAVDWTARIDAAMKAVGM